MIVTIIGALVCVILQGTLVGPIGKFVPAIYMLFALVVIMKSNSPNRLTAALLLGLLADLFSAGRFGGFALSFILGWIVAEWLNKRMSPNSTVGRLVMAFFFILVAKTAYLLFADTSMTIPSMAYQMKIVLIAALGNSLIAPLIWPIFATFLTKSGKPVTYAANE